VITQDAFVAARKPDWDQLEHLLDQGAGLHRLPGPAISRAATLYRAVCADLMRAQAAGYAPDLLAMLDALAGRGHSALYRAPPYRLRAAWDLVRADFPRALRRNGRFFALALALFVLPGVVGFVGARSSRSFALGVMPAEMAEAMEESYKDAPGDGKGREESTDVGMAGFYIYNNVGIAFRCFATGVLFGVGSAFFLIYNGLLFGAVAGLLSTTGRMWNLLTFAAGHGAFELTAIVISGAAGLVMGYALVSTGGYTRFHSLRTKARDIFDMIVGAALMLLVAAFIEGFWSPSSVPRQVKWAVAGGLYLLVTVYLWGAGRGRPAVAGKGPGPAPERRP
jgi:uncharacterized membrane protein SpoIIM required for sporulation